MPASTPAVFSLARKWRPQRFADVVGQEPAVRVLQHALERGRLHPVLLFTGVRGVGKTTLARLVAKALNCEKGIAAEPCNECSACRALEAGTFVDFLEIDAASRTRVEETRELLANVPYSPASGRFRVYLIDEVHMLSGHSFNALLKTLEEPPPHVVFILATTDPERIPPTVLSRCLRLSLRRVSPEACQARLAHILEAEGIGYDAESLRLVTRAAEGSLRDALSLVDQAIAYSDGTLRGGEIASLLGAVDDERLLGFLLDLAAARSEGVRAFLAYVEDRGLDVRLLVERLLTLLSRLALEQLGAETSAESETWTRVVHSLEPEAVQLFYEIAVKAYEELRICDDPGTVLRMAVVRMLAFRPLALRGVRSETDLAVRTATDVAATRTAPQRVVRTSSATARDSMSAAPSVPRPGPLPQRPPIDTSGAPSPPRGGEAVLRPVDGPLPLSAENWLAIVPRLPLQAIAREAVSHLGWGELRDDGTLVLHVSAVHANLLVQGVEDNILKALRSWDPRVRSLRIEPVGDPAFPTHARARRRADEEARARRRADFETDPLVQDIVQNWGGRVRPETFRDRREDRFDDA